MIKETIEVEQFLGGFTPTQKFQQWFAEAQAVPIKHPEAFTLATVDAKNQPNARIVLMKDLKEDGLTFYTNYESQKAQEIAQSSIATALFYWDPLFRQVKFTGLLQKVSRSVSEDYWRSRPRVSQIGGWASQQSQPVAERSQMDLKFQEVEARFKGQDIPCPPHWGGYLLSPTYVEFWLGREGRFHDRWTYQKVQDRWTGQRLYP